MMVKSWRNGLKSPVKWQFLGDFYIDSLPRRPPQFDASLAKDSSEYMLYGVALHCVFAVLMPPGMTSQ